MKFTRRDTMAIGGAAVISTLIPSISVASTNDLIMGITGGADAVSSGIDLTRDIEKYSYSIFGICCCAIHILCLMLRGAR